MAFMDNKSFFQKISKILVVKLLISFERLFKKES